MRTDTATFAAKNVELAKRPRYVIELAFDPANTIFWYFTSHTDAALPPGASSIPAVIEGMSGTSQTLNPDTANATIGNINFTVVDRASIVTTTLGSQLVLGRSTRRQRVRVYVGFEGLVWADYTLVQTQLVTEIAYSEGAYKFTCADIQREMRKDIFELAKTTLAQSLSATATVIEVFSTAAYQTVAHGTSYSDAPSATVGYVKIQDEVIRYTSKTSTQFILGAGGQRGALNTRAVEHAVDAATTADQRTQVEEYVYLELPAVDLMYRLLTGKDRLGNAVMPAAWNLGIATSYVRLSDFTGIGADLWDTTDDDQGFVVRLEGLEKTDGKKFIESELALLTGVFMPVYADGALGVKRMSNLLAGAAYSKLLDNRNLVDVGDVVHDFNALRNVIQISWNWEPAQKDFTRVNLLIDAASIATHGRSDPLKLKFRGLHGSRHSSTILAQRFDALRDRFTGPPLRVDVKVLPSLNTIEVGDVERLKPAGVRDFVTPGGGALDRSFEVQNISIDWITGDVGLKLFASSQAAGAVAPTADATVLADAWYSSQGTNLSSVLTVTGSNPGHVTANGTLTGAADMNAAGSIFYYAGDLVIDPGVTINVVNNVQLRIKGFFQNNGTLSGRGNGIAGAAAGGTGTVTDYNPGTAGFIGSTEAGGGFYAGGGSGTGGISLPAILQKLMVTSVRGATISAPNSTMPSFNLAWDGTTLSGLPGDLRGSSGSSGMPVIQPQPSVIGTGGSAGGKGGAGLAIVSRGLAQGAAGVIDTSGGDGSPGGGLLSHENRVWYSGSGAGGAPGGLLVLLDGASTTATGLTEAGFVAQNGRTPIVGIPFAEPIGTIGADQAYSYFVGSGDGTTFALPSLSGSRGGNRVQYVPGNVAAAADLSAITLAQPTNLSLASGTAELLLQSDGTLVPRILVTWTPSLDSRTLAYDLQFKPSSDTLWLNTPQIFGQSSSAAYIAGVVDGDLYDVRLRAAGSARQVSDWVTITNYLVLGKTELPSNVAGLAFLDPFLSWTAISDEDRRGYIVRYQPGSNTDWDSALPAHKQGFITETRFDTSDIVGGQTTFLVKSVDTSDGEAATATSILVDLRPATPTQFLISRQPDGTREFVWSTMVPPADLDGARIRYFLGAASDWGAMTALHTGVLKASPFETNQLAAGTYTFAAKNVDRAGNESVAAIFITSVTIGDPRIAGAIEDVKEEPFWLGTKIDCHIN